MEFNNLQKLGRKLVNDFNDLNSRLSCAEDLKKELDKLEKEARQNSYEYLKRAIIILYDVIRINPIEEWNLKQINKFSECIEIIISRKEELRRRCFEKIYVKIKSVNFRTFPKHLKFMERIK